MNVYDSERMTGLLRALNFKPTERIKDADLILFNSCTVREKAKQKLLSDLGRLKPFKAKNKNLITDFNIIELFNPFGIGKTYIAFVT